MVECMHLTKKNYLHEVEAGRVDKLLIGDHMVSEHERACDL